MSLRGNAAVREALRRAEADAARGLEGLDLGPDERGLLPIFHLVIPESWAPVPEAARVRVLDWLLDAGADGDACTPVGSSVLEVAIENGLEGVVRRLLERGAVLHVDSALGAAFRGRRITLARELLARGAKLASLLAPGVRLADVVRDDLVTPRDVDVRYRASAEPQRVRFSVRLVRLESASAMADAAMRHAGSLLQRLGAVGVLGSDRFAPRESRVEVEDYQFREAGESVVEATSVLQVRGVSPAGLALVLRGFVTGPGAGYPMSLTLAGDLPLDEGPESVDTARAISWFGDAALDPIRPFPEVPFAVESRPRKKTLAVVRHEAGRGGEVLAAIRPLEEGILPRLGSVTFDAAARTATMVMDGKPGDTQTEIALKTHRLADEPMGFDMNLLRTLVLHALAAVPGVTTLRWCLEPAEETPVKPMSDTRARRPRRDEGPTTPKGQIAMMKKVIERITADGKLPTGAMLDARKAKAPAPLPEATLSKLTFADGTAVPPSLREWLAFDAAWQPLAIDTKKKQIKPSSFAELLAWKFEDSPEVAAAFEPLQEILLPGPCYRVYTPSVCSDGSFLFLYPRLADEEGEAPVLGFDFTDDGLVGVFAPSFDVYMARALDLVRFPTAFGAAPGAHGKAKKRALDALVTAAPAKLRKKLYVEDEVISVGSLAAY